MARHLRMRVERDGCACTAVTELATGEPDHAACRFGDALRCACRVAAATRRYLDPHWTLCDPAFLACVRSWTCGVTPRGRCRGFGRWDRRTGPSGVVGSPFAADTRPRRARNGLLRRAASPTCRAAHWHRLRSAPMYARCVLLLGPALRREDVRLLGDDEREAVPFVVANAVSGLPDAVCLRAGSLND